MEKNGAGSESGLWKNSKGCQEGKVFSLNSAVISQKKTPTQHEQASVGDASPNVPISRIDSFCPVFIYWLLRILKITLVTSGTPPTKLIVTGSETRLEKESVRVTEPFWRGA